MLTRRWLSHSIVRSGNEETLCRGEVDNRACAVTRPAPVRRTRRAPHDLRRLRNCWGVGSRRRQPLARLGRSPPFVAVVSDAQKKLAKGWRRTQTDYRLGVRAAFLAEDQLFLLDEASKPVLSALRKDVMRMIAASLQRGETSWGSEVRSHTGTRKNRHGRRSGVPMALSRHRGGHAMGRASHDCSDPGT